MKNEERRVTVVGPLRVAAASKQTKFRAKNPFAFDATMSFSKLLLNVAEDFLIASLHISAMAK